MLFRCCRSKADRENHSVLVPDTLQIYKLYRKNKNKGEGVLVLRAIAERHILHLVVVVVRVVVVNWEDDTTNTQGLLTNETVN